MSNVIGLHGLSKSDGTNILVAAYGNGFVNVATGLGYGIPITSTNNVEMDVFLESLFFQNYVDTPLTFNGTTWGKQHVTKLPLSKYIKQQGERVYLGYVKIGSVEYPSRVWYSDLPSNNTIQWGYEIGTNGVAIAGNTLFSSANAGFKTYGIKKGDPLFIISGSNIGQYAVQSVSADQQLILTEPLPFSGTGISYWVGGNFIDFNRDDGDFITWLEENDNQLIAFKRDSLHRYDGSRRVKIRDAVGTTSGRSVANLRDLTIYFHGSQGVLTGIYAYDGTDSVKISSPIDKHIAGISTSMYTSVVGWTENNLYRLYVGDINNSDYNLSISSAVCTYDYSSKAWSVDPITDIIKVATQFRQSGTRQTYFGTDDDEVILTPNGNDFNGSSIPWGFETKAIYPSETEIVNTFNRIQIISEFANGTRVLYKLLLTPYDSDKDWNALGQLDHERSELYLPESHNQASGIKLKFIGIDTQEATAMIKKISIFYVKGSTLIK